MSMHIRKSAGVSAALALATSLAGCSSHSYEAQARTYAAAVTEQLVARGACATADACQQNQRVLWRAGGWQLGPIHRGGVSIAVYQVADPIVADALIERCRQIHAGDPGVPMLIEIYANAHIDNLHRGTPHLVKKAEFPAA